MINLGATSYLEKYNPTEKYHERLAMAKYIYMLIA